MYNILTVHWKDPKWINIQEKFLKQYLSEDFRVFAFLNDIDASYEKHFDFVLTENIACCSSSSNHAVKLNLLAQIACNQADDNDILIFLDGDAFPINDIHTYVNPLLEKNDIVAVRRDENNGDRQPHPIFTAIKVITWRNIHGDWNKGHSWVNKEGKKVTDTGGNLLAAIEQHNLQWHPVLRSNSYNLHPVMFGLYDNLIYHHGAGFRDKITRHDYIVVEKQLKQNFSNIYPLCQSQNRMIRRISQLIFRKIAKQRQTLLNNAAELNSDNSDKLYQEIIASADFYQQFIK